MKEKITFSVDRDKLTMRDVEETSKMAESFFQMPTKPDEIPASKENRQYVLTKIPECDNIIKENGKIIGFTFIVPCNKAIMNQFLESGITEKELFEKVKKEVTYSNFNAIYLCSSFIKKEYRGRGLATQGRIKSIKKILEGRKIKPILFSWPQTEEGKESVERTASLLGFKLHLKKFTPVQNFD